MTRFHLAPEAVCDLEQIKIYLLEEAGVRVTRYVLRAIREAIQFVARAPEAGHTRSDLTALPVKFWPVFSYLIVYNPTGHPIEIVRVLHGRRDAATILR